MAYRDTARDSALARLEALQRRADSFQAAVAEQLAGLRAEIGSAREAVAELHAAQEPAPDPLPEPADEGARLVALDLVTRGTPRDEAVLRLAEAFPGVDVARVFDDAAAAD